MRMIWRKQLQPVTSGRGLLLVTGFIAGLALALARLVPVPLLQVGDLTWSTYPNSYRPVADDRAPAQGELLLVVIVSPTCQWSNSPELPTVIEDIKTRLATRAAAASLSFAVVGLAQSDIAEDGLRFLRRFGRFDELSSGNGWDNTGLVRFMHDKSSVELATPQLVIVERYPGSDEYFSDSVVGQIMGLENIRRWLETDLPLPWFVISSDVTPASGN